MSFNDNFEKLRRFEFLVGSFARRANDWVRRFPLLVQSSRRTGRRRAYVATSGWRTSGRELTPPFQSSRRENGFVEFDNITPSSAGTRSATESITMFAPASNSDLRAASSRPARSDAVNPRKAASESPTAFPDAATPPVKAPAAFPSATPASASSTLTTRDSGHTPSSAQAL